jgi:hypothetical protein
MKNVLAPYVREASPTYLESSASLVMVARKEDPLGMNVTELRRNAFQ